MSKVDIYYFTGTGNSLYVAREIAEKINGKLYSIPIIIKEDIIQTDAETIGIIFPVYMGGLPRIVKRFIKKFKNINSKYIFSICTCDDTTGTTFKVLDKIVNRSGGKLSAAFAIRMPGSFIIGGEAFSIEKQHKLFNDWKNRLVSICNCIESKKENEFEEIFDSDDKFGNFLFTLTFVNSLLSKMNTKRDRYFYTNGKCNNCGICFRICPVENIKYCNGKPFWLHHCEMCLACLQWYPEEAIQYKIHPPYRKPGDITKNMTENRKRYHNPFIHLKDLLIR